MFKKLLLTSVVASALLVGAHAQQGPESSYKKVHSSWTVECFDGSKDAKGKVTKACQMFQQVEMVAPVDTAKKKEEQRLVPIMRASVTLFDKQPVMVFAAPLDVQLSEGLQIRLNTNDDKGKIFVTVKGKDDKGKEANVDTDIQQINFERCTAYGCIAAIPLNIDINNKLLEKFQKGNNLFVNFTFDASAPKGNAAHIESKVSLSGFSDAYTDLVEQSK